MALAVTVSMTAIFPDGTRMDPPVADMECAERVFAGLSASRVTTVVFARFTVGIPAMPTDHAPPWFAVTDPATVRAGLEILTLPDTGSGALPAFTVGVPTMLTAGVPAILTEPETGSGLGARTGIGLAFVLTTVVGADGGDCWPYARGMSHVMPIIATTVPVARMDVMVIVISSIPFL
jgi:hypothetical protein